MNHQSIYNIQYIIYCILYTALYFHIRITIYSFMAANIAFIDELNSDVDEVYSLISKFRKS